MESNRKYKIKETLRTRVFALVKKRKKPALYRNGSKHEGKEKKDADGNTIFTQWNNEDFYKDFSEKYNYKYDTVKAWFTKTMPDYPEIMDIAEYFSVSVDYLIGKTDIESSIDEDFIEVYTGLTPQSIRKLRKYITGLPVEQNNVDAINFLLDAEDDIEVLRNIYNYFFGNYTKTREGEHSVGFLDDREMGGVDFYVPAMQQPLFLSVITNNISKYYATTIKDNPKYADYGKPTYKNKVLRCLGGHFGTKMERLEQVKNEIEKDMERNERMLKKFKNSDDMSKLYLSLIKEDKACLQIVEDMMNEI